MAALAWMVLTASGATASLDRALMLGLRHVADATPTAATQFFRWLSWLGDSDRRTPLILLAIAALLLLRRRTAAIALLVASFGATLSANGLLKPWFARPRPDIVPWWTHAEGFSLPSGHATGAVAFALIAWLLTLDMARGAGRTGIRSVAILLTLLIGLSRPWLGVHWPSDIIAGLLWGGAFAVAAITATTTSQSATGQPRSGLA